MMFVPFLTAGFPTPSLFKKMLFILEEEGAGMIEIGVPYSDPLADGPTIQRSSIRAIDQGMNIRTVLDLIKEVRKEGLKVPLVLFTYYNPLLQMGLEQVAKEVVQSGFNGVLVPDLPIEESQPLKEALKQYHIPLISLIAPTSFERIEAIAKQAEGFIYIVSSLGVTGERSQFHTKVKQLVQTVKQFAQVPVVLGFGIKQKSQLGSLTEDLDGYVIGSALIRIIEEIEQELRESLVPESIESEEFQFQFLERFRQRIREVQQ
ncbi:tryptophan synthase subunit alpha [Tepidibacillus fermentans]|uniref:Tryptophan synthase alpha chain n=1 Tax=Tepidibacillus fermentans TaxID=1281767 RepID=A0A4R3KDX4_9BACI|nr:tryptophan synthase subunit alpha [Tepidibacillus fermentans]TCS81280.1 tryptophan synthase alpha chain [Tepidibacillus fermentans]